MDELIRRSDVIGLLEDMLLFGEYDIIAGSFSKADEEKAYRAINDIPAVNRWIPCSERMPETDTPVICYMRIGQILVMELSDDDGWYCGITRYNPRAVTHWMPLPEPPESEVHNG